MQPMSKVVSEFQALFQEESGGGHLGDYFGSEDSSLIASAMGCEKCGSCMTINKNNTRDGRNWYCGKKTLSSLCKRTKSIRHGSFFSNSRLRIATIIMMCYEFFQNTPVDAIHREYGIHSHALSHWRRYCTDVLIDYIELNTDKIGGQKKVIEIFEFKIGKRKYNWGHFVEGQWVLGGIECVSGRSFLIHIPDGTADTLVSLMKEWIEPSTSIIYDYWRGYNEKRLKKAHYKDLRDNHSLHFIDSTTAANEKANKSTGQKFKALPECNKYLVDYGACITWFMFRKICFYLKVDPFVKFLDIIRGINWTQYLAVSGTAGEESEED